MTNKTSPKVLIIAYYWPPSGGGGVQRWLKFTKYLPYYGWHPIVYVPYNPQYPLVDPTLMQSVPAHVEVIKGHIWEARRVYRRLKKIRHGKSWSAAPEMDTLFFRDPKNLSWFGRLSLFLRSNLFVPDSRSLWINPSVRRLRKWLAKHPVDAIISTGPPHSCHMIGLKLHRSTGIPWIADFRDPWLEIDYFPQLMLTTYTRRQHEKMQEAVLKHADKVITVSWSWANLFRKYGAKEVEVITNGFDAQDLIASNTSLRADQKFIIANIGTLEMDRNPRALWNAMRKLLLKYPELQSRIEIHLAGKTDTVILQDAGDLASLIQLRGYLSHQEALKLMRESDLLLLPLNEISSANTMGRIPGKLFEYMAMGKPILMLGNKDSDAGKLVTQLNDSWCIDNTDEGSVYQILHGLLFNPPASRTARSFDASRFERQKLTGDLARVLNQVVHAETAPVPESQLNF